MSDGSRQAEESPARDTARAAAQLRTLAGEAALQDGRLRDAGLELWIGAEPTFTRRDSQEPQWLWAAEGGDKEERARRLATALAARLRPAAVWRVRGRKYPGEAAERFCYGVRFGAGAPEPGASELPAPGAPAEAARAAELLPEPPWPGPRNGPDGAWLTLTPDPAVVEVNTAPAPDLETFARWTELLHDAATEAGLSPVRFRWNGHVTESGGGGQLTFGGPTPERSPFFTHPRTLPALLRYLNHHPALSYYFGPECAGSASQGPRPDEGVRERFDELCVTLERLGVRTDLSPALLWESLAPLLVDGSGNSHRAELNIEKLWNPWFTGRGQLGLVEWRALGMQPTAARAIAVAALVRAVVARCALAAFAPPLQDWGATLHDRFALPTVLEADLEAVLDDLATCGVGLGPATVAALRAVPAGAPGSLRGVTTLGDASLAVRRAVEFWPLVGDVASQERQGARVVDSSTERLELRVEAPPGSAPGVLLAAGRPVPLVRARELDRRAPATAWIAAVRFRTFQPRPGFHPDLPPLDPVPLLWERAGAAVRLELHGWKLGGGGYDALPATAEEAEARVRERAVATGATWVGLKAPPPGRTLTVDLRRPE